MIQLIRDNRLFFSLCMVWFLFAGVGLLCADKGAFSLWLNGYHSPAADIFFRYATWLGDGTVIAIVCFLLFFVRIRFAILSTIISFTSAFLISLIKKSVDEERPVLFFKGFDLHYVNGIELYQRMSFPSGHTAAAFTLFCLFAIFTTNKNYAWLFFILSVITAISRVYLFQHFFVDVYFGSLFGLIFTLLLYQLINRTPLFKNKKWPEKNLITMFKKRENKIPVP